MKTPNPTPADRLEAALKLFTINDYRDIDEEILSEMGDKNVQRYLRTLIELGIAHLADLRRENTRTASASMEAKPQAGSRPLIRHYVDEQGNEMVALAKWFYDEMVSCMPDGPPTALEGEE